MKIAKKIRKTILNWLLKDGLPDVKIGEDPTVITGAHITLPGQTSDPTLSTGRIWMRSDLGLLSYSPDGSATRRIPYGSINVDSHASRHASGGADAVSLDASQITSGRFTTARMPDGASGYVLTGQGTGVDPAYTPPPLSMLTLPSNTFLNNPIFQPTSPGNSSTLGMVIWQNRFIFTLLGLNLQSFYCFDVETGKWNTLTSTPVVMGYFSCLVGVHDNRYLYATRGDGYTDFYRYDIYTNSWSTMASAPEGISSGACYDGARYIYVLAGGTTFYRYDTLYNSWTSLASTPNTCATGNLVKVGNYIYALRGNSSADFYRYDITNNSWSTLTSCPVATYMGALAWDGGNYIYALAGWNTNYFYRYSISGNSWTRLADTPYATQAGGLAYVNKWSTGGEAIYVRQGNSTNGWWLYKV